jgi:hypothetical protein
MLWLIYMQMLKLMVTDKMNFRKAFDDLNI